MLRTRGSGAVILGILLLAGCGSSDSPGDFSAEHGYRVEIVAEPFDRAWGMAFLPAESGDRALVTERTGRLSVVDLGTGNIESVGGEAPAVAVVGQGGLLDVALHPDFGTGREWVYLTYAASNGQNEYATYVGRGRLVVGNEGYALDGFEVLHVAAPFSGNTGHFGSRIVFDNHWRLYVTSGDRRNRDSAQDLQSHWGKILRLGADGTIPPDNPFVGDPDALDAIYTYGHRNPQGMTLHPETGVIWENEHGERDGDEINIINQPGGNYGWPIATYSREYGSGEPIGELPSKNPDTVPPVYYWDGTEYDDGQEGFPPSGMAFYYGDAFPGWTGNLFMGNLAHRYLGRFEMQGDVVGREHRMLADRGWRIRDVRVHPRSGHVYVLVDDAGAPLVRIVPES